MNTIIIDVFSKHMSSKALFRQGTRARALCPGTKNDVVQTPWCPRSNRVLVRQFSARQFVYCNVGRHKEKAWELGMGTSRNSILSGRCRSTTLGGNALPRARCPDFCSGTAKSYVLSLFKKTVKTLQFS